MERIQYTPIGKTCQTPRQKMERYICQLEWCVLALAVICMGMAIGVGILLALGGAGGV